MPSLSPTMTEGTIIKWLKKEGDKINPGDVICEIQTDKAVVAYEIEEELILAKIIGAIDYNFTFEADLTMHVCFNNIVPEDTKDIKIGTLIALTVEEGEDWKSVEMPERSSVADDNPTKLSTPAPSSVPTAQTSDPGSDGQSSNSMIGPSVRNLLHQYGLSSDSIKATGPHNILLKGDVLSHISSNNLKPSTLEEQASKQPSGVGAVSRRPSRRSGPAAYVDLELSNMRKIIAKRLTESKSTIPHLYMVADCEMSNLVNYRSELKASGVNVSVNDFIIKASGLSLEENPAVNVRWNGALDSVEGVREIDISIAVATPNGLITPIVKNANALQVSDITAVVRELADRAKQGKLQPHEFQGGSFSISNLGMFGIKEFSAVINPPQSAILAIGSSRVVVNANNIIETKMSVTLSYDARAIDEETAAAFLESFKKYIQEPVLMTRNNNSRRLNALVN